MKRILKITGYILLGLIVLIVGIGVYLNARYNKANEELIKEETSLSDSNASFYHFEFENDSISEWSMLPRPKKVIPEKGQFRWPQRWQVISNEPEAKDWVSRLLGNGNNEDRSEAPIKFIKNEYLATEGYTLRILPAGIEIMYSSSAGAYYALVTLHHLKIQFPEIMECVTVQDEPDLSIRGVMLDISRDKVPKMNTLKEIVDIISLLKYNHIQLYVEGFSFGYPSFKELWEGKETPITPEEIRELDAYCKERFIELVPNQNSLGHMQPWLETEQYAHLAECPEGYDIMPMRKMKTTLDPTNAESIELIERMMHDLLPNFSSNKFNANLDEPFELGKCKNATLAEEIGIGQLYLDYVMKVYDLAKAEGKEFWMWGDIIGKHPELLDMLPKDITVLEWGYEAEHPFDLNTKGIKEQGLDFMVCPGTSSWMTLTGRTDNMLGNIENAVLSGLKNGARGMLLTDWGDMGHWQYQPISYPGFAYAGAISWNSRTSRNLPLKRYLNTYIFEDKNQELANVVMEMGRSYHFEESHLPNMSHNFMAYQFGIADPVLENTIYSAIEKKLPEFVGEAFIEKIKGRFENKKMFEIEALNKHLDNLETELNGHIDEGSITSTNGTNNEIRNELRNGIEMVRLGAEIRNYGQQKENRTSEERIFHLTEMQERLALIQKEHRRLWLLRNKEGGLDRSMKPFQNLENQINNLLKIEHGGEFGKQMERMKEKLISGGANWYLEK
ncbi:beta-N-acetylhexosaminidase [Maribacter arenosus]|uniref:beta-N-acetylhexosaminidase n=1 Tax=Maribacter arenosus TaxID=1854708 RepID=A0ABR7VFW9_9FLAO|nr:family 20 glycosylhydrolase [Maribacter arenosus]MBD0851806.1 family 20 glycosylhydrolase [Maribacter arenosus]